MMTECWTVETQDPNWYSQVWVPELGHNVYGHRFAYEALIGPIADGMVLHHKCVNPPCYNPWHLEVVSQRTNVLASDTSIPAVNARKTHCKHGHKFTEDNTYTYGTQRKCKTCVMDRQRKYRQ